MTMTTTTITPAPAPDAHSAKRQKIQLVAPEPAPAQTGQVRHLYRASVKLGEDFRTLECEVSVPVGASDDLIAAALETAARVRQAQADDAEAHLEAMREAIQLAGGGRGSRFTIRDPEAPASDKQRKAIDGIARDKGWSPDRLVAFCEVSGIALLTLSKGQASWLIDTLNGAPALPPVPVPAPDAPPEPLPFDAALKAAPDAPAEPFDDIPF